MAAAAGRRVLAGGNLGEPALDLLDQPTPDLYVLELSSFQLDTTTSLTCRPPWCLNVTADHLDRYASVGAITRVPRRVFLRTAATMVLNADDPWVAAHARSAPRGAQARDLFDCSATTRIIRCCAVTGAFAGAPRRGAARRCRA